MVFCPKCGARLYDDADVCTECGFSLIPDNVEMIEPLPQEEALRLDVSSSGDDLMPDVTVGVTPANDYISPLDDFSYDSGAAKRREEDEMASVMPSTEGMAHGQTYSHKAEEDDTPSMPSLDLSAIHRDEKK